MPFKKKDTIDQIKPIKKMIQDSASSNEPEFKTVSTIADYIAAHSWLALQLSTYGLYVGMFAKTAINDLLRLDMKPGLNYQYRFLARDAVKAHRIEAKFKGHAIIVEDHTDGILLDSSYKIPTLSDIQYFIS